MKTSAQGIALIESFEGCRLKAYKALASEVYYTIGFGHYGPDVTPNMVITKAQAEDLLRVDLAKYEKKVDKYMATYHFNQNQYDALVSFCYNVGNIDTLTARGMRSIAQISECMPLYCKSGKVVIPGLVNRRRKEKELFDSGIPIVEKTPKASVADFPTLRIGSKGYYCSVLRQSLNYWNIRGGCLPVNEHFDNEVLLAVIEFQGLHGLKKDGIVGQKTWSAMMKV